jgi:uncharacterized protein with von Willebrand factor type A (vWA) domain
MPWRTSLLEFVAALRAAGMRISIAESLDAMHAVMAAGLEERGRLHEALAAALLKDEGERALFDDAFARFFGGGHGPVREGGQRPPSRTGLSGLGGVASGAAAPPPDRAAPVPPSAGVAAQAPPPLQDSPDTTEESGALARSAPASSAPAATDSTPSDNSNDGASSADVPESVSPGLAELIAALGARGISVAGDETPSDGAAGQAARSREAEHLPFTDYGDLEYHHARDTLAVLRRRLRTRLGRRLRLSSAGRIDLRRTVRAAIQHGGILMELKRRNRRPRHLDLILLGDVSGSMRYAAILMLELVAGAREFFRHIRSFVYVDSLAEASFERGHLVTTPPIDFHARSDFGKVLAQLWNRRAALVTRATVIVIIGDGRNNRRPPRAELLRDLRRNCRTIIWLNPEPLERWGTGDSSILRYAREVNHLIFSGNLMALERGLERIG